MASRDHRAFVRALAGQRLPALICDRDAFDRNAAALRRRAGGLPIRVASKSVRCPALLERVLEAEGFHGVLCFSVLEAVRLSERGIDDLVVAYPSVETSELAAAAARIADGARIVLMVDDAAQLGPIEAAAGEAGVAMPLCIDMDLSLPVGGIWFGVRRSPIRTPAAAVALAREIGRRRGLRLVGLMGYEAQIAGLADSPGHGASAMDRAEALAIRGLKAVSRRELATRRGAIVAAVREEADIEFVNGGGTGSLESTAQDSSVTEVTAGSGLYAPRLFDGYAAFSHQPAFAFALPVTRRPAPGIYTLHGGGYIASGAAGSDRLPRPWLPEGAELIEQEGAGEVQTPIRYRGVLQVGDPVVFRHPKAGEVCERFNEVLVLGGDPMRVIESVPTYRGMGWCFL